MAFIHLDERTEKRTSGIAGVGLFARVAISAGTTVAVKGGHIMTRAERDRVAETLGPAEIQIADDLFIGPLVAADRFDGMLHLNHSCDPNVGIQGQIVFMTRRAVTADEELTFDYAMGDDDDWAMDCRCATALCRGRITGQDWRRAELQRRYAGYFASYLQARIDALSRS